MPEVITSPITKVRTPDGVLHDFSTTHYINIPAGSDYNVNWAVESFTGSVDLISGTTEDYLLTVPGDTSQPT